MKKHLLRVLCMAFVLSLCLPMVACDMEFGGIVGELLADRAPDGGVVPDEWNSNIVMEDILPNIGTNWNEDVSVDYPITTPDINVDWYESVWDTTEPGYADGTTEPPIADDMTEEPTIDEPQIPDPVMLFSLDEFDVWIGEQQVQQFFTPGQYENWSKNAVIDDYNVEYVRVLGWVAFSSAQIGEIGYCIDGIEYVFDSAFLVEAEQAVIDFTLGMGAGSASRIKVMIPVKDLSGEHTVEIVARDEFGVMQSISEFTIQKQKDPYAPVFVFDPLAIQETLLNPGHDVISGGISEDGSHVTLICPECMDPFFNLIVYGSSAYTDVKFIVLAYRSDADGARGEFFVGSTSGPNGQGDHVGFDYVADGKWHTYVLDLSKVEAINDSFDVKYLRYDLYVSGEPNQTIDVGYIAGFDSMEDVIAYQLKNNLE